MRTLVILQLSYIRHQKISIEISLKVSDFDLPENDPLRPVITFIDASLATFVNHKNSIFRFI